MIAAYLRESTNRQDITTQRKLIQDCCDKRNISSQEFADDAVSGTIPFNKRAESRKLLALAKQGKIEELIVYRFDRLGRDHADTYSTIGELLKYGVKLFSLKEGYAENTSSGRFQTGIKTLVSQYEREVTLERSADTTKELAGKGVWLGGIVPYGFRQLGEKKEARLVLFEEPFMGCPDWNAVKVIRRIYKMAADGKSCFAIADDLTRLGVPPVYKFKTGAPVLRGRRKQNTAVIWRPSHIRNLIVNKTYKGVHEWGKRGKVADEDGRKHLKSKPRDEWITRSCPPIVDEALWEAANATLHRNQIAAMAHASHDYLLRGLIRCGICGLTFCGMTTTRPNGKRESYYRCNGKQQARGLYGKEGKRCPSSGVRGEELEAEIWADIGVFLSKPGAVIRQLEQQMIAGGSESSLVTSEVRDLEAALARKGESRRRALDAYTEEWISKEEFGQKLRRIDEDTADIERSLAILRKQAADAKSQALALGAARTALDELREKTRGNLSFQQRRRVVEALVASVTVAPVAGQRPPSIRVRYAFDPDHKRYAEQWDGNGRLALGATGRGSCNKRDFSLKRECRGRHRPPARQNNS